MARRWTVTVMEVALTPVQDPQGLTSMRSGSEHKSGISPVSLDPFLKYICLISYEAAHQAKLEAG